MIAFKALSIVKEVRVSRSCWVLAVWGVLAAVSVGCGGSGPKLYPASGTVTYEDKPLEGATVMFIPQQGAPCIGTTDASGKYTISTRGQPGAATGSYNVTVVKTSGGASAADAPGPAAPASAGEPTDEEKKKFMEAQANAQQAMIDKMLNAGKNRPEALLPHRYSIPEGSNLRATVTTDASKNVFDFPLTP